MTKSHDRCIEEVFCAKVTLYLKLYHKNGSVDVANLCCTVISLVNSGYYRVTEIVAAFEVP